MIGAAIRQILTTDSAFTAIAGSKVYPLRVEQGVLLPAVAYQIISNRPSNCKEGNSNADVMRVQINTYSEHYSEQEELAGIIRAALDGFSGSVLTSSIANIAYQSETDLHSDDAQIYFKAQDYIITINR